LIFGALSSKEDFDVNQALIDAGLLRLVVSVLKQIYEVDLHRKMEKSERDEGDQKRRNRGGDDGLGIAGKFRNELMRIIANLTFANKEAQDLVYDEGEINFSVSLHYFLKAKCECFL